MISRTLRDSVGFAKVMWTRRDHHALGLGE